MGPAQEEHSVVIVGAGIAGLATAVALKLMGVQSLLLEWSHELRTTGAAISLLPNAWRALDALGIADKLAALYQPFDMGRYTNLETGETREVHLGSGGRVTSVHRKVLLEALAEELPPGSIRFGSRLVSIKTESLDSSSHPVSLHFEDGTTIKAKALIGCDGVHSVVAQWLGLRQPIEAGRSAIRGLAVFPEGHGFKSEVHQFLGDDKRAGFVPLHNKDLYWFILYRSSAPRDKEIAKDPEAILKEVTQNLAKDFPEDYLEVVKHSELKSVTWAPLMFRVPWDLIIGRRTHKGCVTVTGDAMHPMTPDAGQGGCTALEDAVVLARCVGRARTPVEFAQGIKRYADERRWRVAGVTTLSYFLGRVQQSGTVGAWQRMVGWFRDYIFYKFMFQRVMSVIYSYDCGVLVPKE